MDDNELNLEIGEKILFSRGVDVVSARNGEEALGGIGAYYGSKVSSMELMLFEEFGPEAIYKVEVSDFPVIISIDSDSGIFF